MNERELGTDDEEIPKPVDQLGYQDCQHCNNRVWRTTLGDMAAKKQGWFFQKDGKIYCPTHVPDWVINEDS